MFYHYSVYAMYFIQLIDFQVQRWANFYYLNYLSSSNVDISIVHN